MEKTIIKQLFKINKTPFPWQKAINAQGSVQDFQCL